MLFAEYAGIERNSVRRLINNHKKDFEKFDRLRFEISTLPDSRGQKVKIYQLNRNQAMLLITYLDNTKAVRDFKIALVKRFDEMEKELQNRKIGRIKEKAVKRTLNEAIDNWKSAPKFPYPTMNSF
uniref:Rha family transcriptional regulator n=1 Tax=Lactococcus garvieae TaxID=1363 RepID=UPI00359CA9D2